MPCFVARRRRLLEDATHSNITLRNVLSKSGIGGERAASYPLLLFDQALVHLGQTLFSIGVALSWYVRSVGQGPVLPSGHPGPSSAQARLVVYNTCHLLCSTSFGVIFPTCLFRCENAISFITLKALEHYRPYMTLGGNDERVRQLLQATKQE